MPTKTLEDLAVEFLRKPPLWMTWAPFTDLKGGGGGEPLSPETLVHAWSVIPLFPGARQYGPKPKTLCGKPFVCPEAFSMRAGEVPKCEGCEAVAAEPLRKALEELQRETVLSVVRAFALIENVGDLVDAARAVFRRLGVNNPECFDQETLSRALDNMGVEAFR